MKLAQHDNKMETNAKTVSQDFGIGDASVVIEILRNRLYEHKIQTLVQEYMSNARDSHREIGQTKSIVVSVPNAISPVFKVRDFGPGITPERMANVFVLYGSSTKRNTNGQTGGFGIGAKSAWSYTDSFTIVSVTDGTQRTYVAHTGSNNQGRLELISTNATDAENGTEIQVAVKPNDMYDFKNAIKRACYFWKESERPTFKGVASGEISFFSTPKLFLSNKFAIGSQLSISNLQAFLNLDYSYSALAVVDGIPYQVGKKLSQKVESFDKSLHPLRNAPIIFLDNGVLEVGANRESLSESQATKDGLAALGDELSKLWTSYVKSEFSKVKTNAQWIETFSRLNDFGNVDEHSIFGDYRIEFKTINSNLFSNKVEFEKTFVNFRRSGNHKVRCNKSLDVNDLKSLFYIDQKETNVSRSRRIKEYLAKGNKEIVVIRSADGGDALTCPVIAKVAKDLGAKPFSSLPYTPPVRIPKEKRDKTKEQFTVNVIRENGSRSPRTETLASVEASPVKMIYVNAKNYENLKDEIVGNLELFEQAKACILSEKTIEMVKGSKSFIAYETWKKTFKPTTAMLEGAKWTIGNHHGLTNLLAKSKIKIKHPIISKAIAEYGKIKKSNLKAIDLRCFNMLKDYVKDFQDLENQLTQTVKKEYPLLGALGRKDIFESSLADELAVYINAKV